MSVAHHDPVADPFWPRGRSTIRLNDTRGEKSRTAKISNAQAVWIVRCAAAGVPVESLAAMAGLSVGSVQAVVRGDRYREATMAARREVRLG